MQEHIRRAHPEHYIAKLPATEESFLLMISTSPTERPHVPPTLGPHHGHHPVKGVPPHGYRRDGSTGPGTPRRYDEYSGGAMFPAAAALAQLHNHKSDSGWDSDGVSAIPFTARRHSHPRLLTLTTRTGILITRAQGCRDRPSSSRQYSCRLPTSPAHPSRPLIQAGSVTSCRR